jgi:hypothetical protein
MKILMVLTSHDKLGNTGRNTGFWLEEFAAPYSWLSWKAAPVRITWERAGDSWSPAAARRAGSAGRSRSPPGRLLTAFDPTPFLQSFDAEFRGADLEVMLIPNRSFAGVYS